jgi:DNA-binding response OmpR family regulator
MSDKRPSTDALAPLRILVVEDELKVAVAIETGLEADGHAAMLAHSGEDAFARLQEAHFDIVLLDLGLPDRDGLHLLAALRKRGMDARVLILTARDTLDDRVTGLDSGADDYLVKPFALSELLARVRALARRGRVTSAARLTAGDLQMDVSNHTVTRAGRPVDLTVREFSLLERLLRFEGEVVSRDTLGREVWQERNRSPTLDNVIDVHVARLRRKVDFDHAVKLIHTIRGVGFMLHEGTP